MGYQIAIDGPAGAGKSTIAKLLAERKGFIYVDTGAMYRGLAWYFLTKGIRPDDEEAVTKACEEVKIDIAYENGKQQIYVNDKILQTISGRKQSEIWHQKARPFRRYAPDCWNCSGIWQGEKML